MPLNFVLYLISQVSYEIFKFYNSLLRKLTLEIIVFSLDNNSNLFSISEFLTYIYIFDVKLYFVYNLVDSNFYMMQTCKFLVKIITRTELTSVRQYNFENYCATIYEIRGIDISHSRSQFRCLFFTFLITPIESILVTQYIINSSAFHRNFLAPFPATLSR